MAVTDRTFPNIVYRIINSACLFLVTILFSRVAGAESFGILSLFILNATFINLFTSFGADSSITFHIANHSVRVSEVISYIIRVILLQGIFAAFTLISFYDTGNGELLVGSLGSGYEWLIVLVISVSIIEKYTALLNGSRFYTLFSKSILISNLLFVAVLTSVLIAGSALTAKNTVILYVVFSVLQAVLLMCIFHTRVHDSLPPAKLTTGNFTRLLTYSLIAYAANLFQFLAYRMDLWIIQLNWEEDDVGLYSLAARFAQLLWLVPLVYAGLLFPRISSSASAGERNTMMMAVRLINAMNVVAMVIGSIFVYWLLPLFSGEEYTGSIEPFLLLLPGVFFFSITLVLASYFAGINKLHVNLFGSIACFLLILVLDLLLIPRYGIRGAAIASSVGYTVVTIYFILRYANETGDKVTDLFLVRRGDLRNMAATVRHTFSRSEPMQ